MYLGIYKFSRTPFCTDTGYYTCDLEYDGLKVTVQGSTLAQSRRKANRAMAKEWRLREKAKDFLRVLEGTQAMCPGPCCNEDLRNA